MNAEVTVKRETYAGLFAIALATLMFEILLTRIFSVTMWYHFAFMATSVAMFGMTLGAVLVYLLPNYFTKERAKFHLASTSLLFAISIVISFLAHINIPFVPSLSIEGIASLTLTYIVISIPFLFSGICICLALTKFPHQVSKLYAYDLAGASLGCILLVYIIGITDGPTAVIIVAFLASIGAILFASDAASKKLIQIALISTILLGSFAVINTILVNQQSPLLRLMWVKGKFESAPIYEKWNSFSRITVSEDRDPEHPFGWGFSAVVPFKDKIEERVLKIDASAATVITKFDGDFSKLEYLKYDITNLAHYLRKNAKVLAIGSGGGRDILSALLFGQKSVLGVEINHDIINAITKKFGDFTGHLDKNPKVTFVADEARSYIARSQDKFDLIQVSLIDTWAATASGAFVLSENSLYTIEGWKVFLEHLTDKGILTLSRWYVGNNPGEMYRLTALATASLKKLGIENTRDRIIIVRRMFGGNENEATGVGTMLVSKQPFSKQDLDTLQKVAKQMQFEIALSPQFAIDNNFKTIADDKKLDEFVAKFPLNIAPPTDDSPFFFNMLRLRDAFNPKLWYQEAWSSNLKAVVILGALLIIVVVLTFLCIIVPLLLTTKKAILKDALPLSLFFAGIGLGFMLVEISQMQRLIVFLGHPTYGLSVVLFSLLLSSGLGSYSTQKVSTQGMVSAATLRLFLLLFILYVFGRFTPHAIALFENATTTVRILVATGILLPLGFFMGMAFPLGMQIASKKSTELTPWLWGINGATSVCASVLAVAIAINSSISASFWTGFTCYVVAVIAFVWASRDKGVIGKI
ncbi:hypothetical protein H6S82_17070 [Planktothrix sp. FACHB-1355]|uniref:Spermidine synthase n=1 Tax=Aerosakkonema funiforme FACHB-1375 TaxID=2949571 RepID=A0A926VB65_9CYAN|nr:MULTISPECIES: hypothetical protein [Oscillatoriales]MBD2179712.1 hypothetical protein [Aerosakkonema funiforme FACHB-1375]MBD3560550.1 hypothetical protein [Planktothrix sp. FACHB-1355]